jgi:diguanylate cyclase (GGDEF)-like protein
MASKIEKLLMPTIYVSFGIYALSTFLGNLFLIDLMSPVTVGLVILLLTLQLKKLGPFKHSTVAMIIGLILWFIADILFFCSDFVCPDLEMVSQLSDEIYMYPNAFFALCISIYMISSLKKDKAEIAFLLSNTLCFAIICFVFIYRFHTFAAGQLHSTIHYKELVFFFLSFFTIMMCFQLFLHIGWKNVFKGTVFTNIGVLGYAIIDLYYDFMIALDRSAENDYLNLMYVFFIMLMGVGTTIQLNKNYDFEFIPRNFSKLATKRRFFFVVFLMALDVLVIYKDILPHEFGMYIMITLMSYLIINYILYAEHVDQLMIASQKEQNALLEKRVLDKTIELEVANENLKALSTTDMLTNLQNRRAAHDFLLATIADSNKNGKTFAIFCSDLNHFKPVNDTYGHEIGDRVLAEFGKRMNQLPSRFSAFRVGGDEFMIVLTDVRDHEDAEESAKMVRKLFNTPIISDSYIFNLSASIGIAIFPDDCSNEELLIKYADAAMYDIKRSKNKDDYKFFDANMTYIIERKAAISRAVGKAVPDKDYTLHYQPVIDANTGAITGVEVYPHLKGAMEDVSPSELVPVAEEKGIMGKLGTWTVQHSLSRIKEWKKDHGIDLGFAINLSPLQLTDAEFIEALERLCDIYGIEKSKITLDISNEVIVGATSSARDILEALHNFGFQLSLNDFGGNNINLSYLMNCGINCIKLSRTLIAGIEEDESKRVLIESIIKFAATMGITVAAVGIETKSQYEILRSMGITQMQGYLICKPIPHDDFEKLLSENRTDWF